MSPVAPIVYYSHPEEARKIHKISLKPVALVPKQLMVVIGDATVFWITTNVDD
jgi:hypothetical protein